MEISKKIKICYIVSVDMTLKFMLLNQLIFLRNQGYDVYAICSSGKWVKDIEKENIKVKIIKFKRKISPFSDIIVFFRLYFYFKKEKFDIIHVHTLKPEFYGQIAAKLAKVPIILNTLHGFDFSDYDPFFKKFLFISLERIAANYSTLIFTIARHIIERAIKEKIGSPNLFKYLGRDIDTNRFNPNKFSEIFIIEKKKQLGVSLDRKIIGIVARLVVEKGYLDLFQSLKNVIQKFPETLLLIIGQEELEKKDSINQNIVKNYGIENNVMFLGERTDMEELYSVMDVFVLPSHREGLGAAILEASAMEKPVIATNTGGCPEIINNGETGILVPVKTPEKLSEALIFILENSQKAKEMGKMGRQKIVREFSEEIVFSRLWQEYNKLINKNVL